MGEFHQPDFIGRTDGTVEDVRWRKNRATPRTILNETTLWHPNLHNAMLGGSGFGWLVFLGLFGLVMFGLSLLGGQNGRPNDTREAKRLRELHDEAYQRLLRSQDERRRQEVFNPVQFRQHVESNEQNVVRDALQRVREQQNRLIKPSANSGFNATWLQLERERQARDSLCVPVTVNPQN